MGAHVTVLLHHHVDCGSRARNGNDHEDAQYQRNRPNTPGPQQHPPTVGRMGEDREGQILPVDNSGEQGLGLVDPGDRMRNEVAHLLLLDEEAIVPVRGSKDVEPVCSGCQLDDLLLKS